MEGNKVSYYYFDGIVHREMTPEEREEELKRLQEESDKLIDWLPT